MAASQGRRLRGDTGNDMDLEPHTPQTGPRRRPLVPHATPEPSLRNRSSDAALRSTPLSRLLRRHRPAPAPIIVPELAYDESPPITAVPPPPPPPLPSPLLAGCPGREISGAKSDGREWACDFDSPPVLGYPDDLSKTEFHEHPLARHIKLEKGWEKEQLALYGLILPAKVDNGTPTYTWESDEEDEEEEEEEEEDLNMALVLAKPSDKIPSSNNTPSSSRIRSSSRTPSSSRIPSSGRPPTPSSGRTPTTAPVPTATTEQPRTPSNLLHKVKSFANFVAANDLDKDVPELPTLKELLDQFGMPPGTPAEPPRTFLRPTKSSGSLRPKTPIRSVPSATKLRNKRSTGIEKSKISDPVAPEEMRRVGSDFSQAVVRRRTASESERISSYAASLRSPSNLISPSVSSNLPLYLLQPQHPTVYFGTNEPPPKFRLAPPRLSPMEYTRQYLLAKAKAEKQGEECTVSKPDLFWAWTEDFKEFLLLPTIPDGVTRNFLPDEEEVDPDWKRMKEMKKMKRSVAATEDTDEEAAKRRSFIPLPLNIAPSSPLLPAHLRASSQSSVISTTNKLDPTLDAFTLDQAEEAPADQTLLQSTKSLVSDTAATIPRDSTDFFVAVQTSSDSEFASSFPPQFLSTPSLDRYSIIRQQAPIIASERDLNTTPPSGALTATDTDPRIAEQLTFEAAAHDVPGQPAGRPPSIASSQRTVTTAIFAPVEAEDVPPSPTDQVDDARSEITAVYRPGSALSTCTVIRSCSPIATTDRDENDVSPNSINYDPTVPPEPVSPLNDSPVSPQTEVFAPVQGTRTPKVHDTLDDAQTHLVCDETVLQSATDEESDFGDFSSVYSQGSVVTAVHCPVSGHHRAPPDFMSMVQSGDEIEDEEDLTPRQPAEPSFTEPGPPSGTLHHSPTPTLRPLSYIPNTEAAQTHHPSTEISQDHQGQGHCHSPAADHISGGQSSRHLPIHDARAPRAHDSRMEADIRRARALENHQYSPEIYGPAYTPDEARRFDGMQARLKARSAQPGAQPETQTPNYRAQEASSAASVASSGASQHDRYSTVSQAASDAPSITSASTADSHRSQALSFTSVASSDRSTTSKHGRRSRNETTVPDAAPGSSHSNRDAARFPPLDPVMESPAPSNSLRMSATSPVVSSGGRSRKSSLRHRREPSQQEAASQAPELPPLKVRRQRTVADLAQIPVSQAYPKPLRYSTMKSPSPATTAFSSSSTARPSTSSGVTRSTSRLIADIGQELNREMEDVLSPRSASLLPRSESPDESDVETPTRRPRKMRSMRSMHFDKPSLPAPNRPLPLLPGKKTRSEAPAKAPATAPPAAAAFVDAEFGPGPAVSHAPPTLPPPPPPPSAPLPAIPKRATPSRTTPSRGAPSRAPAVPVPPVPPIRVPPVPPVPPVPVAAVSPVSPVSTVSPVSSVSPTSSSFVTRADFSVKKDRSVRPAASVAAFSYRPTAPMDQPHRLAPRIEPAALPTARTRLLGKMASMAELKHRREAGSGGSGEDAAVGMRTFLGEDGDSGGVAAPVVAPSSVKPGEGGKKKFFGGLFRRKKDGEK